MIDQAWQSRLPEGMIRCYLVHDKVAGFGCRAINALFLAPPGAPPESALPAVARAALARLQVARAARGG